MHSGAAKHDCPELSAILRKRTFPLKGFRYSGGPTGSPTAAGRPGAHPQSRHHPQGDTHFPLLRNCISFYWWQSLAEQRRPPLKQDLKPANIFYDARGDVKLGDFGLAKFTATASDDASADGATGDGLSTLHASPT